MTLATISPWASIDWASLAWVFVLGGITWCCLRVERHLPLVLSQGRFQAALAHVAIGWFSLGMMAFGAWCVATTRFPVPGGAAWEGGIAVVGGLATFGIGACTAVEHALRTRGAALAVACTRAQ